MYAVILRGLGFGDEGKGTITAYLARELGAKTVIRDSGGPQGGHRVVDGSGREHTFSQFSSATFQAGVKSYLSGGMMFKIPNFVIEARKLAGKGVIGAAERVKIDPACYLVTPMHTLLNRVKALAINKASRPGSVGMGVGEAVIDRENFADRALRAIDCLNEEVLRQKLDWHYEQKLAAAQAIADANKQDRRIAAILAEYRRWMPRKRILEQCQRFRVEYGHLLEPARDYFPSIKQAGCVLFEGTQGALLDPVWGFLPHVTKTCTTAKTARKMVLEHMPSRKMITIGILRAYATRHGFGPFVTEESGLPQNLLDAHGSSRPWQGKFRAGWLDLVAARYGIAANRGIDSLALTNLDRLSELNRVKVCVAYCYQGERMEIIDRFFEWQSCPGGARLEAFKPCKKWEDRAGLAEVLFECWPLEYRLFPGWKKPIGAAKEFKDLPIEARNYVSFFESKEGLDVPVSVISVGERSGQKFLHNPLE